MINMAWLDQHWLEFMIFILFLTLCLLISYLIFKRPSSSLTFNADEKSNLEKILKLEDDYDEPASNK